MKITQVQLCGLVLLALVSGALLSTVVQVHADQDPRTDNVPRVIPYQGTLELNGEPVNAIGGDALEILFTLYDGVGEDAPAIYNQRLTVEVFGGRFMAPIGPTGRDGEAIQTVISGADDLHLGMTLLGDIDDPDDNVAMSGRQRLLAAPYTLWSSSSTNFTVANSLSVGGPTVLGENLDVNGVSALNGDVVVGGDGAGSLVVNDNITATNGDLTVSNGRLLLKNIADASPVGSGALVIGDEAGDNITIDGDEIIARNNGAADTLHLNLDGSRVVIGRSNNNTSLNVHGTIRGNFAITRRSATASADGNTNVNCNSGEKALSCGVDKDNAGDEDVVGCYVHSDLGGCTVWHDQSGGSDGGLRGYCVCLDIRP